MATEAKGDFLSNLGRVYTLYTGGFLAFIILLAILEYVGLPDVWIGYAFMFFTLAVYAIIGIISRTAQVSEYYVAGRRVPAFYNGMATASDWMSAASFIGMAGTLYALGYDGLAFILGWTGGYVLVAILVAPYLRKFGAYTVPDFLFARYGGRLASIVGIVVLLSCSFTYVVAQIVGTGLIASRFLGMSFELAVFVGLAGILVCSMLGGMRAVTWTQVAQYIVLIIAYLLPVVILSTQKFGIPIPQLTYGTVLQEIAAREQQMVADGLATAAALKIHAAPGFASYGWVPTANFFGLVLCLMVGTASLPHVLMRYFTTPSVREARKSVGWSLLFIFILYFTAPSYAAFAKLEVYTHVIGQPLSALASDPTLGWVSTWGKIGLVKICGVDVTTLEAVRDACAKAAAFTGDLATFDPQIKHGDLRLDNDAIVIATPEIAGLPYVIAGLVAAGGLAAALSTADGLLLAIANALSHDVYYRMIDPNAPTSRRLIVARILLVIVAIVAAYVAAGRPADIVAMVAWAFSLAAAGLFPALVLGIWWKRTNKWGAIAGMVAGFAITAYYLWMTRYHAVSFYETWQGLSHAPMALGAELANLKAALTAAVDDATKATAQAAIDAYNAANPTAAAAERYLSLKDAAAAAAEGDAKVAALKALDTHAQTIANWFGIRNISAAVFGLPVGFLVMIVVSLLTPAPSKEMQTMIDDIRKPRGKTLMEEKAA